ncbi:hypothetical protein M8A51_06225 [Schlegelella sp. S2-27]|uniref:Uncharacterized protein n=1 Tax=Caldimonas mangrovi TaxID=2944811 RepID=A0ABT0YL31_9BURK|nr:hypothetical protein [Caldimonas mangrovi]MCM5679124.1 hypothetical protein [Caldimonas mangrovi]
MHVRKALIVSVALTTGLSVAAIPAWEFSYKPAQASFATFGGGLGDPVPPSEQDSRIAFQLRGQAAREMFDAMGPDKTDACSSTAGERFRSRDDDRLTCTRSPKGEYACYFGFDLKTGASVGGSVC